MKRINYKKYTELFNRFKNEKQFKEEQYKQKYGIGIYDSITSVEHPEYFKISAEWNERRKKLDEPILKNAYYKIGDEISFAKRNTYESNEGKPYLLIDKRNLGYILFDINNQPEFNDEPELDAEFNFNSETIYYENIISRGVITQIRTSDSGSGEILYLFNKLIPNCPESNPCCLEKDVITSQCVL
jgi:hypothetical protein